MISAVLERCAGIDVGKKMLAVCVMTGSADGEARHEVRTFGTTVEQLKQLREWFQREGCTHAVMESTGTYWKPVFNILEESLTVILANPHEVKARKGHKTDHKDAWWLAHLLRHGMITPSFIPPRSQRDLRDLTRRRRKMIQTATGEKNRIDKVLQDANVKLSDTLSDIFGVSGQLMLEALLEGEADPAAIAAFAKGAAKKKIPEIIAALEEHQMREHHRTMIGYSLDHLRFLEEQLIRIDERIRKVISESGYQRQWELLQTLPGVQAPTAAVVLAEVGPDVKAFASEKKLSSWTGVAPGNNKSAGKSKSSGVTNGNRWLRAALTESAWAASKMKSGHLREKFRRLAPHSRPKAVVAIAHDLLILTWNVLQRGTPYEEKKGVPMSPEQQQRLIRHHVHRLGKLGIRLRVPAQPNSEPKCRRTRSSVND
jgi:transposase